MGKRAKVFLSAGEASGDHYGALLIAELRRQAPQAEFFGLGGARMEEQRFRRVARAEDVAVMGITEVLRHAPRIYSEYRKLKAAVSAEKPDLAILIDFPDVNLRLARQLRRLHVPVVYFVSPQLWAWKKWRIHGVKHNVTRMLVIFPFEEAFYRRHGIAASFVGHPLTDLAPPAISREAFARQSMLDSSKPWIGLLPGSRKKELLANLPPMLQAAHLLGTKYEYLLPIAPTLKEEEVAALIEQSAVEVPVRLVQDARAALLHSRASVVASGTVTVEAALMGNPFLVVYRVSPLTHALARRVVSVPHVGMVNLIAGRRIVPELIQDDFTAAKVVEHLTPLLEEQSSRATMQSELATVAHTLRARNLGEHQTTIEHVAGTALGLIADERGELSPALVPTRPVQ